MSFVLPDALHFLPPKEHKARKLAVFLLAVAPFLFGCLAIFLGQDANWDLRNYHWYNAYAFVHGRFATDFLPSQTPWFYNPTLDVPFYLLATHLPAIAVGFILGAVQGFNFVLLFMLAYATLLIANPRHKVLVCAALAALGMLGGGGIAQIGTVFYDNVTSLGLFLSALMVARFHDRFMNGPVRQAMFLAVGCGFPAGMAMGFKLPCFTFCFGLCAALLLISGSWQRRLLASSAFGVGILLGVALTLGHWAWFLQSHFGSPLFPYFNQVFQSPLAPLSSARDTQYVPRSLHDFFLFPFVFTDSPFRTGEIPWRDWRIPILYVLLPLAVVLRLVFGRSRYGHDVTASPQIARYLLWSVVLSYFAWLTMFGIYRYVVPIEMLAPLLIVISLGLLPIKPSARALLTGFILLVVAASVQPGNWGRHTPLWLDHFVEVERPELGDVSHTMLLMAGFEPYSHIVTQFPPEMPVVRIQSNFTSPDQDKAINALIHARVDAYTGKFLILIPDWQHPVAAEALRYFKLAADWKACQIVKDRLFGDTVLDLCPVSRIKG
jgi:hypothetical protein